MKWYTQIYRRRSLLSCVVLCILTVPLLMFYRTLAALSPYHPLLWVSDCISSTLSLSSLFHYSLYLTALVLLMFMYSLTTTASVTVHTTRLNVLMSAFSPTHLLSLTVFSVLGGVKGHCLSQLTGYPVFREHKFNEEWIFMALYGVFGGICYGCRYYGNKNNVLVIPSIQQSKLFSLRGHTSSHFTDGLVVSLKDLRWFYPLYLLSRPYLRSKVTTVFGVQWSPAIGWFNFELLLQVVIAGAFSHAVSSFALRVFRVFQTEAVVFPVMARFTEDSTHLLTDALKAKHTLLRNLAFLDLWQLSWQPGRRCQVFTLDRAGRPIIWEELCTQCLNVVHVFTNKLNGAPPVNMGTTTTTNISTEGPIVRKRGWSSPELTTLRREVVAEGMAQLWSYSPPSQLPPAPQPQDQNHLVYDKVKAVRGKLNTLPSALFTILKKKPFFVHFLSILPGSKEELLFSDSRLVVWAVSGLSELAVASYTEDQYGVVQKSLGQVLSTLISLSMALDKHVKAPLSSTASTRNTLFALERNGKYAIKTAVSTSLHRLERAFSREKKAFQLTDQQLRYWTSHSKH